MLIKIFVRIKISAMFILLLVALLAATQDAIPINAPAGQWRSGATTITAIESINGTVVWVSGEGAMGDSDCSPVCGFCIEYYENRFYRIKGLVIDEGVTHIGKGRFNDCRTLTFTTIPSSVISIGDWAFFSSGLISIRIPATVLSIGRGAFWDTGLIEVDVNNPNYSSIDGVLFNKGQTELIQFPNNKIGSYTIPSSVITIEFGAFMFSQLTSVTIPSSVTSIEAGTFYMSTNLASVSISDGITEIKSRTFLSCKKLTSITIPASVHSIAHNAFDFSTITSFTILNPIPPKVNFVRGHTVNTCLYVPQNSIEAYRNADFWKDFKCIKNLASAPKEERS